MTRRAESPGVFDRRAGRGSNRKGRFPGPMKVEEAALNRLIPVRLAVGHPPLQSGDLRSNRRPGTSSGADAALTAATPDHNLGIWAPKQ